MRFVDGFKNDMKVSSREENQSELMWFVGEN